MKTGRSFLIFIASLATLVLSSKLFWNVHLYTNKNSIALASLFGGKVWLYACFITIGLIAFTTVLSGAEFFRKFYITCKYTIGGYIVRLMRRWADMA